MSLYEHSSLARRLGSIGFGSVCVAHGIGHDGMGTGLSIQYGAYGFVAWH